MDQKLTKNAQKNVLVFWKNSEYFGKIWNILELFGIFWKNLESFGKIWNILEKFGIFWINLEHFSQIFTLFRIGF